MTLPMSNKGIMYFTAIALLITLQNYRIEAMQLIHVAILPKTLLLRQLTMMTELSEWIY